MRILLLAAILLSLLPSPALASLIKDDEEIVFFTTAARRDGDQWVVPVHAWVFEPEGDSRTRKGAIAGLIEALELDASAADSEIFKERARWFLVDNESDKQVALTLASARLPETGANGHVQTDLRLPVQDKAEVTFSAQLPHGDKRVFSGRAVLVPEEGVSVISDIDDTIKISEVLDKKRLMKHTFLKPFEASPGMVAAYQRLAKSGAAFHYVSSSPWQLYPALNSFMETVQYPVGSVHLRTFRLKDETVFNMMKSSEETKPPVINKLLSDYPKRSFILIGDSGEKDPEIYGKITRENKGRVKHIYIRDVTGDKAGGDRYQKAFTGIDCPFTIFSDASLIKP
ncbi:MAG: phosphatidate phosphatase App1 family protein [Verrucomicrobiales bacterium]